ncbi:hypothetical protein ILUMI_11921, partial [Ignelater luminosus]
FLGKPDIIDICKDCNLAIQQCASRMSLMKTRIQIFGIPDAATYCLVCKSPHGIKPLRLSENNTKIIVLRRLKGNFVMKKNTWICTACEGLLVDLDELYQCVFNSEVATVEVFEDDSNTYTASKPINVPNPRPRYSINDSCVEIQYNANNNNKSESKIREHLQSSSTETDNCQFPIELNNADFFPSEAVSGKKSNLSVKQNLKEYNSAVLNMDNQNDIPDEGEGAIQYEYNYYDEDNIPTPEGSGSPTIDLEDLDVPEPQVVQLPPSTLYLLQQVEKSLSEYDRFSSQEEEVYPGMYTNEQEVADLIRDLPPEMQNITEEQIAKQVEIYNECLRKRIEFYGNLQLANATGHSSNKPESFQLTFSEPRNYAPVENSASSATPSEGSEDSPTSPKAKSCKTEETNICFNEAALAFNTNFENKLAISEKSTQVAHTSSTATTSNKGKRSISGKLKIGNREPIIHEGFVTKDTEKPQPTAVDCPAKKLKRSEQQLTPSKISTRVCYKKCIRKSKVGDEQQPTCSKYIKSEPVPIPKSDLPEDPASFRIEDSGKSSSADSSSTTTKSSDDDLQFKMEDLN